MDPVGAPLAGAVTLADRRRMAEFAFVAKTKDAPGVQRA
jgi:hypothetical protein